IAVPTVEGVVVLGPEMSKQPNPALALVSLVVTVGVIAAILLTWSRSDVDLDRAGLRAGLLDVPADHLGRARVLDEPGARRVLGVAAQATALLSLRPWIRTAVQIELTGDETGAPYAVIATRRPGELLAAVVAVAPMSGHGRRDIGDVGGIDGTGTTPRVEPAQDETPPQHTSESRMPS
ncbi:MAG: hypothetical protein QOJ62_2492, partial [Actinomycetota bacterium]|nr:hypothetical protein [Actinomycetota bacterium]